jgi:hypothetical protein
MTHHDEHKADLAPVERFDENELETLNAWTLEDFDDLLYLANCSAHYPFYGGEEPYQARRMRPRSSEPRPQHECLL